MNDPGLDEPIQDEARTVENETEHLPQNVPDEADNDDAYIEPSRWWFASTAFPLVAVWLSPTGIIAVVFV
jgi:potassium channel subfamily K, other eukaryote